MKKRNFRMNTGFIALACFAAALAFFACKKSPGESVFVSDIQGAGFYTEPDVKAKELGRLKCGEKLGVISRKTLAGKSWVEAQWGVNKVWMLENFLAKELAPDACEPGYTLDEIENLSHLKIVPGPVVEAATVEEAAKNYYEEQLRNNYADAKKENPDEYTDEKIGELIAPLLNAGVKTKKNLGNYAVITHGVPCQESGVGKADALWQKSGDGWRLYIKSGETNSLHLAHLNNDNFPDAVNIECISDSCSAIVYLGRDGMTMKAHQGFSVEGGLLSVDKLGKCGAVSIRIEDHEGKTHNVTFDCNKNRLVVTK